MSNAERNRYMSGDTCSVAGRYRFDGYVDKVDKDAAPPPRPGDLEIFLDRGEEFPTIPTMIKPCWWVVADVAELVDDVGLSSRLSLTAGS